MLVNSPYEKMISDIVTGSKNLRKIQGVSIRLGRNQNRGRAQNPPEPLTAFLQSIE